MSPSNENGEPAHFGLPSDLRSSALQGLPSLPVPTPANETAPRALPRFALQPPPPAARCALPSFALEPRDD